MELNYTPVQLQQKQLGLSFSTSMDSSGQMPGGKSCEIGASMYSEKTLLMARVDHNFNVNGRYHTQLAPSLSLRSLFQSGDDFSAMVDLDYKDKHSFTHYKFTHSPNGAQHVVSYQQSLTQKLSVGSELMVAPGQGSHISFAGRFNSVYGHGKQGDVWTANISSMGMAVGSYAQKLSPHVSLATEVQFGLGPGRPGGPPGVDSGVQMGVLYKYQTFRLQSNVRSNLSLQMALEQQIAPGMALTACTEVDHFTGASVWGLGFRIG